MKSNIKFIDDLVKDSLEKLKIEDPKMYSFILRAFKDISENAFCGIQIPKRLIPKEYLTKFNVKNLWKYNLPNAWRLIYSIEGKDFIVFSIILDWMDHKSYERKFNY